MRVFLLYCIAFLIFLGSARHVSAAVLFEDNFDDGDLNGWLVAQNFQWPNTQLPCMNGSQPAPWQIFLQRLGININGPSCFTELVAQSLRIPENQSYTFSFDMTMPESMHMDRAYLTRFVAVNSAYSIKIMDNRIYSEKQPIPGSIATYPFTPNATYHIENDIYASGRTVIRIDGQTVLDFMDTPPKLTGDATIGFRASVGAISHSIVWFDNVVVKTLDEDITLNVPYFSQKDPQWGQNVYDRAEVWAPQNPSIKNFGCALTSAVMLLRFYQINTLPDGSELTPASLNTWLLNQLDGYIGNGLVNWIALTRLSKLYATGHPNISTLEYTRALFSKDESLARIKQSQPDILELPGHFIVANGVRATDSTLHVLDPYTEQKNWISEYQSSPLSTRIFSPSHTDLSYIMLAYPEELSVEFLDSTEDIQTYTESLLEGDEESLGNQKPITVSLLPKPQQTAYHIRARSSGTMQTPLPLTVYTYSKDGEVQVFTEQINRETTYLLEYAPEGTNTFTRLYDAHSLMLLIEKLRADKEIRKAYPYYTLQKDAQYIADNEQNPFLKNRYIQLFRYHVERLSAYVTQGGKALLTQELDNLLAEE